MSLLSLLFPTAQEPEEPKPASNEIPVLTDLGDAIMVDQIDKDKLAEQLGTVTINEDGTVEITEGESPVYVHTYPGMPKISSPDFHKDLEALNRRLNPELYAEWDTQDAQSANQSQSENTDELPSMYEW